ncbi:hypothetical protein [Acinetobacter baylyi]|uniref:hypothetical protein n=1 Tax=Acinetobacter baylyi TaxID=202950 RepID=UPI0031E3938B
MKKLLLLSLLSTIGTSTFAAPNCYITYYADNKLLAIIKENVFKFENYDAVCQRLKSANARVNFSKSSAISTQQTTAVVIATVGDKNLPIQSDSYNYSMWSNPERTTVMEEKLLMSAVNDVLNGIKQKDIDSLNENRKKLGFKTYPVSTNIKNNKK